MVWCLGRDVRTKREVDEGLRERDWIDERWAWKIGSGCRKTEDLARRKLETMTSG